MRSFLKPGVLSGLKRSIPILLGYIPVAIAFAILALNAGLSPLLTIFMSATVFGGASQFIAVELLSNGIDYGIILVTTLVVNLRHLLMSFYISNHLQHWRWRDIYIFCFGLTDEAFALHSSRIAQGELLKIEAMTINIVGYGTWIFGTILGVLIGPLLMGNQAIALDFALPAMFIVLLVLIADSIKKLAVAIIAGCVAIVINLTGFGQWSVLLATVFVATIGLGIDRWKTKS